MKVLKTNVCYLSSDDVDKVIKDYMLTKNYKVVVAIQHNVAMKTESDDTFVSRAAVPMFKGVIMNVIAV